jgi:SAM-dependent methyltransferase
MRVQVTGLLSDVAAYYAEKLSEHGDTPRGVDWNGEESQQVRFTELCKIIDPRKPNFSLNDLGCGYGALLDYLRATHAVRTYLGVDVSREMIKAAERRHAADDRVLFITSAEPDNVADYGVASGIFNVRLGRSNVEWFDYLQATLDVLNLELTRFRGHLTVGVGGIHDGRQSDPVYAGVQATDGRAGEIRT